MIVLALDTATSDLVVGLVDAADQPRAIAESVTATRAHNERLVPEATRLMDRAGLGFGDLEAIVVGCGPGPFTGLRVGMATAAAFGQALGIPVHGVVTHDAVAALIDAPANGPVVVATDARRKEIYWARYIAGARVAGPSVTAPEGVDTRGAAVISVPEHLRGSLDVADGTSLTYVAPSPVGLVRAADLNSEPTPLVPLYLRRPDAVPPKPAARSAAIPEIDHGELT
ncbi:tRNA (adenosine(37)-N6)-threonylcarbamoyltransferase complex dimerization subunit type 1 TsaB [Corynebacterium lipophiloflavum]|uniref:Universal bacterial protein YeaZ n=1 Tax=Corynebacterium lipophiloflavum (strain ATCC 700352 / DSM 44291 / CCUG 37336 / JCM 10383 / DMMZ 1944) TaxID=525263 RepID=C0XUT9_CORLD|nr:tRNA (adenosine(37)-N6)-threonylcarbamoyltransferase complex dimerization subunit type 1 TsaB [Corynebacterium lipophiloflavum]EEI16005.1 universal bacterial protein YeaZ [Corynebacterium lipophiloflavum DSM 44291]